MKKESGFTLIEVIVTLILVGIMAAVAGLGIVTAVKGYVFAKDNTVIAGKAQVAMARMTRELTELRKITNVTANSVVFDTVKSIDQANSVAVAIGQNATEIRIATGSAGTTPVISDTAGAVLVDQVRNLSFAYKKDTDDWHIGDDIRSLSHIVVSMTLSGAGGGSDFAFSTVINPRNNGNAGGAPIPTPDNPPAFRQCFVATAAYGNQFHPMVIILKQFRDQYLATWPGGLALIQFYYREGPYLAEMIHDKPWAIGLARGLLLPFVGLSFLLVYARGSIPLLILIIIAGIWLIKRYPRRSIFMKKSMAIHNEKGSILIGLIATMVIMAFLGAAMVSLTSTSGLNQAYGSISQKAYYLAESGFRYAGSQFGNVTDPGNNGMNDDQNAMASVLNGRALSLAEGGIQLAVTPFHFATSADAANGVTTLNVQYPGGTPDRFSVPASGQLQIRTQYRPNATTAYITYTDNYNYTLAGSTVTLATPLVVHSPLANLPRMTSVTVIARPATAQTITPGPNATLVLTNPSASSQSFFMPERNGKFSVEGNPIVYSYNYRTDNNDNTTTLSGVVNSLTPTSTTSFTVATTTNIIPNDFFQVVSVGTVGNVSRSVTFTTPVDFVSPAGTAAQKTTTPDTFDTTSNWYPSVFGTAGIASITGGLKAGETTTAANALRVTGAYGYSSSIFTDMYLSLSALKWSQNYLNFLASWYAHGNTLSYDAQVKVKLPQQNYYMAGLNFRMNLPSASISALSSLGVSFQRGRNGSDCFLFFCTDRDGVENALVPLDNVPVIVLWKKTGDQSPGLQWIAYKTIVSDTTIAFNNGQDPKFANGTNSYYIRGGGATDPAGSGHSGARSNITSVSTTDGGVTGSLTYSSIYGSFNDAEEIYILQRRVLPNLVTARVRTPISSASIGFDRGEDTAILVGDIIVGSSSGAKARVTGVTVSGGSWSGTTTPEGRAIGTINIAELEGGIFFTTSDTLTVWRPNTSHSAHFVQSNSLGDILTPGTQYIKDWSTLVLRIEEKLVSGNYVNDIKVYVGDTGAHGGTPTGSPLNTVRYGNLRWSSPPVAGDIQWPPDAGWSDSADTLAANQSRDHFTLVQNWVINPALSSTVTLENGLSPTGTIEEPNSIVRTTNYTTHSLSSFTQSELGLHTFGAGMSNNTYFDDFAVQMEGATTGGTQGFSSPLQY